MLPCHPGRPPLGSVLNAGKGRRHGPFVRHNSTLVLVRTRSRQRPDNVQTRLVVRAPDVPDYWERVMAIPIVLLLITPSIMKDAAGGNRVLTLGIILL